MANFPWCDCKVAYGIDDIDKFERWMDRTDWAKDLLPDGWSVSETDASGARYVAVFRVEGKLTEEDGMSVLRLLAKHGGEKVGRNRR
jgi:hypothetical protein